MPRHPIICAAFLVLLLQGCSRTTEPWALERDWPSWRGPRGDGTSATQNAVIEWSPEKNVLWKAAVPGRGHSTPIVSGARVFLTTAHDDPQEQRILGYERATGKLLWNTLAHEGGFMRCSQENSQASSTPACDGSRTFAVFVNNRALRVTATDLDGKTLWQSEAGPFLPEHGYASSPVIHKSLVIVSGDNLKGSFIAGLDRATGKVVWRTERNTTGWKASYGSPAAGMVAGKWQVFVVGMGSVSSYEPESGRLLWSAEGPAEATAATAAFNKELVFATGGDPRNEILAIRGGGAGDVTESHVVWRSTRGVAYVPTPIYYDGKLFVVSDSGILTCFEADNGKQLWQGRLEGDFLSSPVIAAGLLYITNVSGKTFVVKTGSAFEVAAENDMGSGGRASLAICDGVIYLRSESELYCIGAPASLKTDYP